MVQTLKLALTFMAVVMISTAAPDLTNYCSVFVPDNGTNFDHLWCGTYVDLFSPDNADAFNYKFVEHGNTANYANDGKIHISEVSTSGSSGKKWNANTTVDP